MPPVSTVKSAFYFLLFLQGSYKQYFVAAVMRIPREVMNYCYTLQAFKREAVEKDAEVTKRMLNIVRQLQANPEMFQACISQLSQEQQVALHQYLTT